MCPVLRNGLPGLHTFNNRIWNCGVLYYENGRGLRYPLHCTPLPLGGKRPLQVFVCGSPLSAHIGPANFPGLPARLVFALRKTDAPFVITTWLYGWNLSLSPE